MLNLYSGTVSGGTIHRKYHSKSNFGGGNIYSEGDVNIYGGLITKGYAWANLVGGSSTTASRQSHVGGGNIYVVNGLLTITGGSFIENSATGDGGAVYAGYGEFELQGTAAEQMVFRGNSAGGLQHRVTATTAPDVLRTKPAFIGKTNLDGMITVQLPEVPANENIK